jgi:dipeptidyl aminopeptidase/acylaminoacyl peptidase
MFSTSALRRVGLVCLVLLVLGSAGAAGRIAFRNYRAAHSLLEADPPSPLLAAPQRSGIPNLRNVSFPTRKAALTLAGWFIPPTNGATVLIAHGTNSDRSTMLPELRLLSAAGFGVLALEWPGMGGSAGVIRWDDQARDALSAAIDWLARQPGVNPERIGGLGFSIGGYMMTQVAATDPRLRAIVIEAAPPNFEDYLQVHHSHWGIVARVPARRALRGSGLLDSGATAGGLVARISPRPMLFLGGTRDTEVPQALVRRLYAAAGEPKSLWIVEGADHGDYAAVAGVAYARRLTDFFGQLLR